jgi:hypothetical protein
MTQKRNSDIKKELSGLASDFIYDQIFEEIEELYSFQTFIENNVSSILQYFSNDGLLEGLLKNIYGKKFTPEIYQSYVTFYTISENQKLEVQILSTDRNYESIYYHLSMDFPEDENDIRAGIEIIELNVPIDRVQIEINQYLYHGVSNLKSHCDSSEIFHILSKHRKNFKKSDTDFLKRLFSSDIIWNCDSVFLFDQFERDLLFSLAIMDIESFENDQSLEKINWSRLCSNRRLDWNIDLIDKYLNHIEFEQLCTNDAVKWDFQLIKRYEHRIVWSADRFAYTAQIYPDKYVVNRSVWDRKVNGSGLYYNRSMVWTDEIVEEWHDKIVPYEIALNGELSEGVVWKYREELMETQLYNVRCQGPRSDREKVEEYRNGFWNLLESSRRKHLSVRILEFLSRKKLLYFSRENYDYVFYPMGLNHILKSQYSWVTCFLQTMNNLSYTQGFENENNLICQSFWEKVLKDVLLANYDDLSRAVLKSFESSQAKSLKKGDIIVNMLNCNLGLGRLFPTFHIVEEESSWFYKVKNVRVNLDKVDLREKFSRITKSKYQVIEKCELSEISGKKYYLLYPSNYIQDENLSLSLRIRDYYKDIVRIYNLINSVQ